MGKDIIRRDVVSEEVHPWVRAVILGLALWLVISVWGFARGGYTDFLLVVVSGFIFVAVAIPYVLWRVWRHEQHSDARPQAFREWTSGEFDTWQGRVKGANAAVEMLLPIAAVAFGMTAFAVVAYFTLPGGP